MTHKETKLKGLEGIEFIFDIQMWVCAFTHTYLLTFYVMEACVKYYSLIILDRPNRKLCGWTHFRIEI